jgi:hypothetical protein
VALLRSQSTVPVPWLCLLGIVGALWIAPLPVGVAGMAMSGLSEQLNEDIATFVGFLALILVFSPLFSWVGWLIALPMVGLALARGRFGWLSAAAIGALAGAVAAVLVDLVAVLVLPFGTLALLALRAVLGRLRPL